MSLFRSVSASCKEEFWVAKSKNSQIIVMTLKSALAMFAQNCWEELQHRRYDIMSQNIQELVYDVKTQFMEQIMLANYFLLQLDECTYISNMTFLVYLQFELDNMKEEFFSVLLRINKIFELFTTMKDDIINKCCLEFQLYVGICSMAQLK